MSRSGILVAAFCAMTKEVDADCIRPAGGNYDWSSATETLTISGFDASGVTCAAGYEGTPGTATVCDTDGAEYSLAGACVAKVCTGFAGQALPTGYSKGAGYTERDVNMPTFDVTGVNCAMGYTGTASAVACTVDSTQFSFDGCTAAGSSSSEGNSFAGVSAGSQVALLVGALMSAMFAF